MMIRNESIGGFVFDGLITRMPPDASTRGRLMRLKHDNGAIVIQKAYGPGGAESEVKQTFS